MLRNCGNRRLKVRQAENGGGEKEMGRIQGPREAGNRLGSRREGEKMHTVDQLAHNLNMCYLYEYRGLFITVVIMDQCNSPK